jgi:CTP:molybdopterin cytidylyltransferase MocA
MGRPKGLLLTAAGVPLLRAHADALAAAGCDVVVVLGFAADAHRAVLPVGARVLVNERWDQTDMAASAALALAGAGTVLLTPVDAPPARGDTIARLLAVRGDAVPVWQGRDGHPVKLAPPHPTGRLDLRLAGATRVAVDDPDCVLNLNTPADWEAWAGRG